MGYWKHATIAAEIVLSTDKNFVKAIYAKAEALYNTCQFEQALVLFHQGKVIIILAHDNSKPTFFYYLTT